MPDPGLDKKLELVRAGAKLDRQLQAWSRSKERSEAIESGIEEAFRRVGGVEYLVSMARDEPKAFLRLLEKLIIKKADHKHEHTPVLGEGWEQQATAALVEIKGGGE